MRRGVQGYTKKLWDQMDAALTTVGQMLAGIMVKTPNFISHDENVATGYASLVLPWVEMYILSFWTSISPDTAG